MLLLAPVSPCGSPTGSVHELLYVNITRPVRTVINTIHALGDGTIIQLVVLEGNNIQYNFIEKLSFRSLNLYKMLSN